MCGGIGRKTMMKDIYLVHVDGQIGAYKPGKFPLVSYAPQDKFIDFVKSLREDYPEFRLRCVANEGIAERIKIQIKQDIAMREFLYRRNENKR